MLKKEVTRCIAQMLIMSGTGIKLCPCLEPDKGNKGRKLEKPRRYLATTTQEPQTLYIFHPH